MRLRGKSNAPCSSIGGTVQEHGDGATAAGYPESRNQSAQYPALLEQLQQVRHLPGGSLTWRAIIVRQPEFKFVAECI